MKYMVVLEQGPESVGASVPDLPGCIAVAATEQEALELIREAIELHVEDLRARGAAVPAPASRGAEVEVALA